MTVDGTDAEGKPIHNEWSGKFDGEDYPVTGDSTSDTRAYKKIDNATNCAKQNYCKLKFTSKKDGKVTMIGYIVVPKDRNSRTVTMSGPIRMATRATRLPCTTSNNEGPVLQQIRMTPFRPGRY